MNIWRSVFFCRRIDVKEQFVSRNSVLFKCAISLYHPFKAAVFPVVFGEMMRASGQSTRLKIKVDLSLTPCPVFKGWSTLGTCLKFFWLLPDIYGSDVCVMKVGVFFA